MPSQSREAKRETKYLRLRAPKLGVLAMIELFIWFSGADLAAIDK